MVKEKDKFVEKTRPSLINPFQYYNNQQNNTNKDDEKVKSFFEYNKYKKNISPHQKKNTNNNISIVQENETNTKCDYLNNI